ncbi:3-oxo-5-alpha-steroid 4-dehydrogenase 1-like [Dioscorea cayenensis subsp. rotundata]|uniref:3-oxo-5-alpha-steroid 4-dehydrogenase 1-like n=1 Tax=Dioscorea cayennensis subsp. rotundata TaxID=55577 RepID=A0AB40CNR2_DIOCR|nr:3-oxo-5-alpha-steroid 4-dehydrogenase 1-like [Dioscorea cayenensis subsp. rotundata]
MALFLNFIFPASASLFLTAMTVIGVTTSALGGISEATGKNIQYSKFLNAGASDISKETKISSKAGMLLVYSPSLAAALASFAVPGFAVAGRCLLVGIVLSLHFFKRVFEVLFIHQYSGQMILKSAITISMAYCINTVTLLYAQYLTQDTPEPSFDLKNAGILLFLIGITGNFYHHYLLSKLRKKKEKGYKIPSGGLFSLVICPHYLFEIIGFLGLALISQTLFSFSWFLGTLFYLMGRSHATRKWYLSKFENYSGDVKALIPFVF